MNKITLTILICITNLAFSQEVDTLVVYQNDTTLFEARLIPTRPCSKPRLEFAYELKNPKDSTYYLIYNEKGQLVKEGLYTAKYVIDGIEQSGFYNSKYYYYKRNGKLSQIFYQKDGRNDRTEYYKSGKLKETRFFSN